MEYRSGNDDHKPLFTGEAEGENGPLKRTNVLFSCSKKDTIGNISGEFILINSSMTYRCCFSIMQCTNENLWLNSDKNEVLNEQSTSWWTPQRCLPDQDSEGWQRKQTARNYSDFNVTSNSRNCESQGEATRKVLNGHQNILTWVCYKHLSRGNLSRSN